MPRRDELTTTGSRYLSAATAGAAVLLGAFAATQAVAQEPSLPAAYNYTLAHPTDYDFAFSLARRASDANDPELAINVLERMVAYNPKLNRAKYEAGVAYFRLGSYEMAVQYFQQVLADPAADADLRSRADAYLSAAQRQRLQSRWSVYAQTGVRYQSNAGSVPDGGNILVQGTPFAVTGTSANKGAWSAFGLLSVGHDYDFQNQRGDVFETRFTGFASEHFKLNAYNIGFAELSLGPKLGLDIAGMPGASIKPYVVGGAASVGNSYYTSDVGAGVVAHLPVSQTVSIDPGFDWRRADVHLLANAPSTLLATGNYYTTGASVSWQLASNIVLQVGGSYHQGVGQRIWDRFDGATAETSLKIDFAPPIDSIPRRWSIAPFVKYSTYNFSNPNPFVDPLNARHDRFYAVGGTLDAAITANFGIGIGVQYAKTASNISNYKVKDVSVSVGPTFRY